MRTKLLIAIAGLLPFFLAAQPKLNTQPALLQLATGSQTLLPAASADAVKLIKEKAGWNGSFIWLARFSTPPSGAQKMQWEKERALVLTKLDNQTYFISTPAVPTAAWLQQHGVTQMAVTDARLKLDKAIASGGFPAEAKDDAGRLTILVAVQPKLSFAAIKDWLYQNKMVVEGTAFEKSSRVLTLHISPKQLQSLAEAPFTLYIQPIRKDKVLNEKARFLAGAFAANAPISSGGHGLNGKGIVVGVGDLGDAAIHPDLAGRINNMSAGIIETHGAHITGTLAGGGVIYPDRRGFAPLATIISQYLSSIWENAAQYVQDFGMVLTNNSYGNSDGQCPNDGAYDIYSNLLDQQAVDLPVVLSVFAAGNSGQNQCNPYHPNYNNILSGFQTAKNVITVGRVDYEQTAPVETSCGPVNDGRMKPEIMSLGIVQSTDAYAGYTVYYGTSQSAPGVTGGLALLYERYRQLFAGQNPQGALMKNILLNGARDVGAPGPDFRQGYGLMHLENSLRILNNHYYFGGEMTTGGMRDTIIQVPAGMAYFKAMLYWHDPAASPLASQALLNDLDLEVIRPDGTTVVYPKKLNPALPNVADIATEAADHLNNSEQVVIRTPMPGNYTIRVKGYDVNATPTQAYYTSFDFVPGGVHLRTPYAGDTWSVTDLSEWVVRGVAISWDDEGTPAGGSYTLEYSLNAGSTWTTIPADTLKPTIPLVLKDTCRYYAWRPLGATSTNQALVRITKNGTSYTHTSGMFSILNRPTVTAVTKPCEGYLTISWAAVNGADDYEVIMKQGTQMVPVAVVATPLNYTIKGLSKDSTYYVGVRARKAGIAGRYNYVSGYVANAGPCTTAVSDGDLKLDSITGPVSGRQFTSSAIGAAENLKVRIKNLDNVAVAAGSYEIKYSIDGAPFVIEPGGAIASLGTYTHTFAAVDFSVAGAHTVTAVVSTVAAVDAVPKNDTFKTVVKNLTNPIITPTVVLASSFVENFDAAPATAYQKNVVGMAGLDRWDYFNHSIYDRARTFVQSGLARSGNRAISLDITRQQADTPNNRLQGTLNLSANALTDEVRLDVQFKQHGPYQKADPKNKIWVRGNDNAAWIEVYDLGANQPTEPGVWKLSKSIELNDVLLGAGQNFTASTQVRIGQTAPVGMADNTHLAGYTFDDVRVYIAANDLQILAIDEPAIYSCGLNNATPIKIVVRNSMATPANGVQVSYSINGGTVVTETIPVAIPGNANYVYQFTTPANFTTFDQYDVSATVNFPGDNVPENNIATATIYNQPIITNYPYLEDFEAGNGYYFTNGTLSSWQWGVPSAVKIDTAASGTKVWKTSLKGNYNDNELSYLNSPCFDLSSLTNPTLSFSFAYDIEDCRSYNQLCDSAWMEYSTDGINWQRLGAVGQGTNWYDHASKNIWLQQNRTHWHVATIPLPKVQGSLRFRFGLASDQGTTYEGIAIDDIHVYDLAAPMYTKKGVSGSVMEIVSGTAPIDFNDGGKLIATIFPNGNNLGSTETQAYIFDGPVRNNYGIQYYSNRNITIKPSSNPASGNVKLRFYFSDKEVDSMRLATTCASCTQIKDYTHLGVTQYTDADRPLEDGNLANNLNGINRFIFGNDLRLVPYDSGYYAEYIVSEFSEFWLNDGRGDDIPLPSRWINIKASKLNSINGRIEWNTASEYDIDFYEVQVATTKQAADAGLFETIGKVFAKNAGVADYVFVDERAAKNGDYYYRIKQVEKNGQVFYSPIRLLSFGKQQFDITLRPNPVKDNLWLAVQSDENKALQVKIVNITGQIIYLQNWPVSIGTSQLSIPIGKLAIGKGVYTVGVGDGKSWWYGKVLKQ